MQAPMAKAPALRSAALLIKIAADMQTLATSCIPSRMPENHQLIRLRADRGQWG